MSDFELKDFEMISPPNGLSELVLRRVQARKNSEFLKYCVKVAAAACFALVILFSGLHEVTYEFSTGITIEENANEMSSWIEQFRNQIFFRESVNFEHTQ